MFRLSSVCCILKSVDACSRIKLESGRGLELKSSPYFFKTQHAWCKDKLSWHTQTKKNLTTLAEVCRTKCT